MKNLTVNQFMITVMIICLLMIITICSMSQGIFGAQIEYSKYKTGAGFFGGTNIGKSYIGINTHVRFTRTRSIPVGANLEYGYGNKLQPFIMIGFETTGGEAVKEREGKQGMIYGGGISYLINQVKIQAGILNNNEFISVGYFKNL